MAINTTPEDPNANAYCTADEASDYLLNQRLYASQWASTPVATQEAAIIWAARLLDETMNWKGYRRTRLQSMRWPRSGVQDPDGWWYDFDSVPQIIKDANAELAYALVIRNRTLEPKLIGQGMKDIKAGTVSITIDKDGVLAMVPGYVVTKLQRVAIYDEVGGPGDRVVTLVRA